MTIEELQEVLEEADYDAKVWIGLGDASYGAWSVVVSGDGKGVTIYADRESPA